jgi:solute carrier family 25 oxoglutarate transporter 11
MVKEFIVGGAAAISASCVTHPLDVLKVRMLLYGELRRGMYPRLAMARDVYVQGGMRAFYTGLSAAVLRQALFSTTRFGLFDHLKQTWGKETLPKRLASTLAAGGLAAAVSCPADVALVRMQSGKWQYRHVVHALHTMHVREGILSWYRGVGPLVLRGMLVTSAQFTVYEALSRELKGRVPAVVGTGLSGAGAALAATLLSVPVDTVKSRYMNSRKYQGSFDCLIQCCRTEGLRGLYKGFVPAYARSAPQVTLMWVFYEQYSLLYDGALSRFLTAGGSSP